MNQQRARRFRRGQENEEEARRVERERAASAPSTAAPAAAAAPPLFDSNCITPGTPFMVKLAAKLHAFIENKVQFDAHWRKLDVLYSGHDAPGEGEHKIAAYIREQIAARPPGAAPVRHCLYGLDADLIMLGSVGEANDKRSDEPHAH